MAGGRCSLATAALAAASLSLAAGQGHAQVPEADGGARVDAVTSVRLTSDDGETSLRTGLNLDLLTATRTQRLTFGSDFGVVVPLDGTGEIGISDPNFAIQYLRDNGSSQFTASVTYRESDVDGEIPGPDFEFDETDLITDDGTRLQIQAGTGLVLGRTAPFGGDINYRYSLRTFTGTADPDLTDLERHSLSGGLRFDLDPTVSLTLSAAASVSDEDDAENTQSQSLNGSVGLSWQISPDLRVSGSVGYGQTETETTILGIRSSRQTEGGTLTLGFVQDRANGTFSGDASRSVTTLGFTDQVALSRSLELPGGRSISGSIGLTDLAIGDGYVTGSIGYSQETRAGGFSFDYSRDATTNNDDNAVLRDTLRATYSQDLAGGARWSVSGSYVDSDFVDASLDDRSAVQVSMQFGIPVGADWDLTSGITFRESREAGNSTQTNRVFVGLERRFSWRP